MAIRSEFVHLSHRPMLHLIRCNDGQRGAEGLVDIWAHG